MSQELAAAEKAKAKADAERRAGEAMRLAAQRRREALDRAATEKIRRREAAEEAAAEIADIVGIDFDDALRVVEAIAASKIQHLTMTT